MSGSNKCYEEKNSERIDNGGGMLFQTGLSEKNYLKSHLSRDLKEVKKKRKTKLIMQVSESRVSQGEETSEAKALRLVDAQRIGEQPREVWMKCKSKVECRNKVPELGRCQITQFPIDHVIILHFILKIVGEF